MRFLRKNDGFTLVELIVTIVVGSIATMAAATVLILGLRIYNNANETALKQNEVNIGITVIENLVAEAKVNLADGTGVYTEAGSVLTYDTTNNQIKTSAGAAILNNVVSFEAELKKQVLQFTIITGEEGDPQTYETYQFSIYCRLVKVVEDDEQTINEGNAVFFSLSRTPDVETILASAVEDDSLTPHVRAFLKTLDSQKNSTGRIQTEDGEGEYYSQWYIGGYENNPDWNAETPWCACFVSWALEQCSGYLEGETPRYANVDTFWVDLVTTDNWQSDHPEAGDLIFFDWIVDQEYNPQHIGVVIAADESRVYTIEGNVNGKVALCSYTLEDERILGYGELNWTK